MACKWALVSVVVAAFACSSVMGQTAAPRTELSPEERYHKAVKTANESSAELFTEVKRICEVASSRVHIEALGKRILQDAGRTTPTHEDIHNLHDAERRHDKSIRQLTRHASDDARRIEDRAREVEGDDTSNAAEKKERKREDYSRHLDNKVEEAGDKGQRCIQHVHRQLKQLFKEKVKAAEKRRKIEAKERHAAKEKLAEKPAKEKTAATPAKAQKEPSTETDQVPKEYYGVKAPSAGQKKDPSSGSIWPFEELDLAASANVAGTQLVGDADDKQDSALKIAALLMISISLVAVLANIYLRSARVFQPVADSERAYYILA